MKLKEKLKRLFALGLAAGITINSIPLSTYAATISGQESNMSVIVDGDLDSLTEGETETVNEEKTSETAQDEETGTIPAETETESTSETEPVQETTETETEIETETETEAETETESETEVQSEPETELLTEVETETESVLEIETETETEEENAKFIRKIEELEAQAKDALKDIVASEYIMALVYLCDSYDVKAEADFDASTVDTLKSGHTVLIQDVAVDTENMIIWYQVAFTGDNGEKTGYIAREYLAYSNENFLAWEENYVEPIQKLLDECKGTIPQVYNDGATNTYSSDVSQFPATYQSALQKLKDSHPNWTFVKFDTGLNWNTVVSNELNPKERSLVYYTRGDAWKNGKYDSSWYYASEAAVKYCLDPRNALTDPRIFQFEQLTYNSSYHTVSAIQTILNSTFMKGTVPKASVSYAQAFYDIGKNRKLSPFHLASRVIQEQGVNGGSALISGNGYNGQYVGYYNYFNVGATSDSPILKGLKHAKEKGWNTPYKSLEGGADTIGNNYILQGQDTLYLQKWDVESQYNGLYYHQYMQNIQAPTTEASTIRNLYNQAGALDGKFVFKIPVYNDMPDAACPEPGSEAVSLNVSSASIKGGNSVDIKYTIANPKSTSATLDYCRAQDSIVSTKINSDRSYNSSTKTVTGTVTITGLKPGTTYVTFTTSGGGSAACKITVLKDTIILDSTAKVACGSSDGSLPGTSIEIDYEINNPKSAVSGCKVNNTEYLKAEVISEEVDTTNNKITGKIRLTGLDDPGTAKVTLTSKYGGTAVCTVKIVRLPEELVNLTPEILVSVDNCKNAHITVLPEDTTNKNLIWESSDESIAVIDSSTGRITGVGIGTATITATTEEVTLKTGEPLTVTCNVTVAPSVEKVEIAAEEIELSLKDNETFALDAKMVLNGAESSDLYKIEYVSADEEIATVDENGVITPQAVGDTIVTAIVKDNYASSGTKRATCKVSVVPEKKEETIIPEYGYIQPEKIQIYKNGTNEEVTENTYADAPLKTDGTTVLKYVITPENATYEKENVTWKSSNPSIVQVVQNKDSNGSYDGTATIVAKTKGNAVVTVSTDIGIQKKINIVVEEKQNITEVTLNKTEAVIYVNGTVNGSVVSGNEGANENASLASNVQLTATPQASTESGIAYKWSSTNEAVATVDENGMVTAKAPGKAVIVAEDAGGSGKYAKCTVTVERFAEEIITNVDELYLLPNKKVTVTANVSPTDHTVKNLEWKSSNEEVATVTQKGVVAVNKNAQAGAETVITLTDHVTGIVKEIPLTVAETASKSVALYVEENGETVKAGTQTLYANGGEAEQAVTIKAEGLNAEKEKIENVAFYATSSNTKVAEVVQNTDAQGKYDGTFRIVAKAKGNSNIKVFAADGSGKSATVKVTVKVYPEQVETAKEALYITPGGSATLSAVVTPSNANEKGVVWKFADGELKETTHTVNGFTLNPNTGKVTVQRGTSIGETAEFVAVTKINGVESETTCKVTVVEKKVTKVKLDKTTVIMAGDDISQIAEEQLTATATPDTATVKDLKYTSNNEAVVTVDENGFLTATGYGMATVTVSTLDNSKKATCKVYVTSMDKAYKISPVIKNFTIQSYASDINSSCELEIKDQFGNIQDNGLFTFTSSKPEVAEVDENGIVTPNKSFEAAKNGKTTITAALTGDPYKRKVTFTVTVLAKEQAETISVTALDIRGNDIKNQNFAVKYPVTVDADGKAVNTIALKAEALNVYGETMDTKLKWTVSDTSVAALKVDKDTKGAVLTIKKAGKFYITCTAADTLKKNHAIQITAVDTKPVLEQNKITLNMQSEPNEELFVQSTNLHFVEDKECPIENITVKSVKKGKEEINVNAFEVSEIEDGYYALMIPDSALEGLTKGNYKVVLSVETKGLTELGMEETVTHDFAVTLNLVNNKPKVSVKAATINCQNITQLETELQVSAPAAIESITLVEKQTNKFDTIFNVVEEDGVFKIKLVDTSNYKASSLKGKAIVKVEGYQPVTVDITVKTPTTKTTLAASRVPTMDMKHGREEKITLYDKNTKETLKNYTIEVPEDAKLDITQNSDGSLNIKPVEELVEKGKYKNGSTVTVTAKVMALSEDGTEELWKNKVNVNISVKAYTVTPTVTLGATTLQLNKQAPGETIETTIKVNRSNVRVADDSEWRIEQYNSKDKKYTIIKDWGELPEETQGDIVLSYNRQKGTICASFKEDTEVKTGNYKYRITWLAEDYSLVKSDVTVVVVDRALKATIKSKGKLDLLTRADSTMQGTITLTNTKAKIKAITIMEPDASGTPIERNENFYSSWVGDNSFRIRLREGVKMTTGKKTVPVKIMLEGGTILYSNVSFTVSQSTPKVVVPKAQIIYKSGSNTTVCYDMNTQIPAGYEISTIKAVSIPNGIGVTVENGRVSVSLTDRHLKPGTYSIKVNMYFNGAQDVLGSEYGKAVQKTLKVTIKE